MEESEKTTENTEPRVDNIAYGWRAFSVFSSQYGKTSQSSADPESDFDPEAEYVAWVKRQEATKSGWVAFSALVSPPPTASPRWWTLLR
jgi:hypothetical protein